MSPTKYIDYLKERTFYLMKFKWHILIGATVALILLQFFNFSPLSATIIFLSSWMIDIDHYFWYVAETKDVNPLHAIRWYIKSVPKWHKFSLKEKEKFKRGIFVFHSIFFWALLIFLSFFYHFFSWIFIGVGIHMVADLTELIYIKEPIYNKMLIFYVIRKNKNKKKLEKL